MSTSPKTLAIASGKGGVGKSNIAANLSTASAQKGRRVLLADADLGLANLDIILGLAAERTIADALTEGLPLQEILVPGPVAGLDVLPASSGILELERMSHDQRRDLAARLRDLAADYDELIIDLGAGLTPNVLLFASIADTVLVITRPEPTAITDAYALIKVLVQSCDVQHLALLVNQVDNTRQARDVHERLANVCQRFLAIDLPYFGAVPQDRAIERAVRAQRPVILTEPGSPAAQSLAALAARLGDLFVHHEAEDRWMRLSTPQIPRVSQG